jgi:hypothetical protein
MIKNGTFAAYHHWTQHLAFPDDLESYLQVNATASKVQKTSRGWKPVGWVYLGSGRPFVPISSTQTKK